MLEEIPTELHVHGGGEGDAEATFIHDFLLRLPANVDETALMPHVETIEGAIAAVLDGKAENDAFNQLVLVTQTDPQAIVWLRAWFRYMRQGGSSRHGYGVVRRCAAPRR